MWNWTECWTCITIGLLLGAMVMGLLSKRIREALSDLIHGEGN